MSADADRQERAWLAWRASRARPERQGFELWWNALTPAQQQRWDEVLRENAAAKRVPAVAPRRSVLHFFNAVFNKKAP
jgi:hypothetical protein